jgi:hypothetical protein
MVCNVIMKASQSRFFSGTAFNVKIQATRIMHVGCVTCQYTGSTDLNHLKIWEVKYNISSSSVVAIATEG